MARRPPALQLALELLPFVNPDMKKFLHAELSGLRGRKGSIFDVIGNGKWTMPGQPLPFSGISSVSDTSPTRRNQQ